MINEKETTMASNEEIIRNLYAVAEKEPKRFRSLFTENGYWWDVPAGVKYHGNEVARAGRYLLGCISGHAPRTPRPLLRR